MTFHLSVSSRLETAAGAALELFVLCDAVSVEESQEPSAQLPAPPPRRHGIPHPTTPQPRYATWQRSPAHPGTLPSRTRQWPGELRQKGPWPNGIYGLFAALDGELEHMLRTERTDYMG